MLIDGFTVVAQVCNFLILVWLLKRFLYRPVLAAIEVREQKIAAQLEGSAAQAAEAKQQSAELERRNQAIQTEREALLREASDQAAKERQRLLEDARNEAAGQRRKEAETLARERAALSAELVGRAQTEVLAIARAVLMTLADSNLEERIVDVLVKQLPARLDDNGARIRSAFDLTSAQRGRLQAALGADVEIRFEIDPQLVCGLELTLGSHKIEWSIAGYFASFANTVLGAGGGR